MTAKIPDKIPTTTSSERQVPKEKVDPTKAGPINKEAAEKEASKSSVTPEEREQLKQLLKNSNWFSKIFVYMKLDLGWLKGRDIAPELEKEIEKEKSGLPSKIKEVEAQKTEQAPEQRKFMAAAYADDSDDDSDEEIDIEETVKPPVLVETDQPIVPTFIVEDEEENKNLEVIQTRPITETEIENESILRATTEAISIKKLKTHLETARHIGMSTQEIIADFKKKGYIK